MNEIEKAALWARAHTPVGDDETAELARLEALIYSRSGSAEPVVDFVDPVTGQSVRATPSQLRLQALRTRMASAEVPPVDDESALTRPKSLSPAAEEATPAESSDRGGPRRGRFLLPLVVGAAFAVGVITALAVSAAVAAMPTAPAAAPTAAPTTDPSTDSAALLAFADPPRFPDLTVPELGNEFRADSLRNISGTSPAEEGFGAYLGRSTASGLYCLIATTDAAATVSTCATADSVADYGLAVDLPVTHPSLVTFGAETGSAVLTLTLKTDGSFALAFPSLEEREVLPPTTPGTILNQWHSLPSDATFGGEIDTNGENLVVALDCVGRGTVTVAVSGSESVFDCLPGEPASFMNHLGGAGDAAAGPSQVIITPVGNVSWGLTIASPPDEVHVPD